MATVIYNYLSRRDFWGTYRLAGTIVIAALFASFPLLARAATLYLDPLAANVGAGSFITVTVKIDTQGVCINAGDIVVMFPPDKLQIADFSIGGSIFSIWTKIPGAAEIKKANLEGSIRFAGGIPGGYCGSLRSNGGETDTLGRIVFKVPEITVGGTEPETAMAISVSGDSRVFANDGSGAIVSCAARGAEFTPDSSDRERKNGWQSELTNDNIPPEQFRVEIARDPRIFDGKYFADFSTTDAQTGIDHYEVSEAPVNSDRAKSIDKWIIGSSPYLLEDQSLGSTIKVKAVDKAGNATISEYQPQTTRRELSLGGLLLIIAIFIVAGGAALGAARYFARRKN